MNLDESDKRKISVFATSSGSNIPFFEQKELYERTNDSG